MSQDGKWQRADLFPQAEAAFQRRIDRTANRLLWALIALFAALITWAAYAEIDEATRAEGRIVPSRQTQVIQNLEGGILAELRVKEGERVKKGTLLLRIDNITSQAQYEKGRGEYFRLMGDIARLKAEIVGGTAVLEFPEELQRDAPEVAKSEQQLFQLRQEQLDEDRSILKRQVFQRQQELAELDSKINGLQRSLRLSEEEWQLNRPLEKSGAISRMEMIRLERAVTDLKSDLETNRLAKPRGQAALEEARRRLHARQLEFRAQAGIDLANQEARLAAIKELAVAEADRVSRMEVIAPTHGIIKRIHFNTIGGVIQPGEAIVEIVPVEEKLQVEAWVNPADIAFLRPGLLARVGITAYDPEIYGMLQATLTDISADTFSTERGESFFRIRLHTDSDGLEYEGRKLPIIPGMNASVDILTGKKTILDYLLNPLRKVRDRAFSER